MTIDKDEKVEPEVDATAAADDAFVTSAIDVEEDDIVVVNAPDVESVSCTAGVDVEPEDDGTTAVVSDAFRAVTIDAAEAGVVGVNSADVGWGSCTAAVEVDAAVSIDDPLLEIVWCDVVVGGGGCSKTSVIAGDEAVPIVGTVVGDAGTFVEYGRTAVTTGVAVAVSNAVVAVADAGDVERLVAVALEDGAARIVVSAIVDVSPDTI